jgi:hypothetical protein
VGFETPSAGERLRSNRAAARRDGENRPACRAADRTDGEAGFTPAKTLSLLLAEDRAQRDRIECTVTGIGLSPELGNWMSPELELSALSPEF